jgi:hypothetical protein
MLRKISVIFAFVVLVINVRLSGDCYGFEQGYEYGLKTFTGGHGTPYSFLWEQYIRIVWGMSFLLIGKTIKNELLSQIICFPCLIWTIYFYWQIYLQKSLVVANDDSFYKLLRDSIPMDVLSFMFVLFLIVFQITGLYKSLFTKNVTASNIS